MKTQSAMGSVRGRRTTRLDRHPTNVAADVIGQTSNRPQKDQPMSEATAAAGLPENEMLRIEPPKMEMPEAFRELAGQGVAQARQNYQQMQAVAEEMTAVLGQTCSTTAAGVADYHRKLIALASASTHSALEFAGGLFATRSLPEIVELSTEQTRRQFDLLTAQNKELWALAERMANECAAPIKQSMTKALDKVAGS
jgi:phasin